MKSLLQRVQNASVTVNDQVIGSIKKGWLIFVGFSKDDNESDLPKMVQKIVLLRLFSDTNGKFNLSIKDIEGEILAVSQFTLYANTSQGNRPSFTEAAPAEKAKGLYDKFVTLLQESGLKIATGSFGADMQVTFTNDGPVAVMLDSKDFK